MNINKRGASFGETVAVLGSVLIAVGVAWLIATNWRAIPDIIKVIILLTATGAAYSAGVLFRTKGYIKIGGALLLLGALLFSLSIFLIALIYSLITSVQVLANLFLISLIGVIAAAYIFGSSLSLVLGLCEFLAWLFTQYSSLSIFISGSFIMKTPDFGAFALLSIFAGVLFYGLNLIHKSKEHHFSKIYQIWAVFYVLLFSYIMGFQAIIPMLWPNGFNFSGGALIFMLIASIIMIVTFVTGAFVGLESGKTNGKEIFLIILFGILFMGLIATSSIVSSSLGNCTGKTCFNFDSKSECASAELPWGAGCKWDDSYNRCIEAFCHEYNDASSCINQQFCKWEDEYCKEINSESRFPDNSKCNKYDNDRNSCQAKDYCAWYAGGDSIGRAGQVPAGVWFLWILSNIMFILVILGVIGYGTRNHSASIVNLGIGAFALGIITRYIGFVMDLWGYNVMAVLFIVGGLILLFGGWLVEKWRKKLIAQARE